MRILQAEEYLENVVTSDQDTLSGDLRCACGGEEFTIDHNGRVVRGLFSTSIAERGKEFAIKACCSTCGKEYLLHCADWDIEDGKRRYQQFTLRGSRMKRWHIHVCYDWEEGSGMENGHWHTGYENVCIDIREENSTRSKRLFE